MVTRMLVATDDTELSRKAVTSAIELAAATGAELVALHVVPRYPTAYFEGAIAFAPDEIGRVEKSWALKGEGLVSDTVRLAKAAGVSARGVTMQSDAVAESIIAAAGKHACDLVVMASHGRRGIGRILLGSETLHVLTHCATPVLVLR